MKVGDVKDNKVIKYKIDDNTKPQDVLCTTYQMRNFYKQLRDGFFTNLDVMNYIQHLAAARMAKKGAHVLDVCCGRSLMLPLLRYNAKDIASYTGVDISDSNIKEARTWAGAKKLEVSPEEYYPFKVEWIMSDVAEMSKHIPEKSQDFVIYTSAIEHMHKDHGYQSLKECHKIMKDEGSMFLSCPNTPGNGYDTQYAAHVYEWGYDELKQALKEIGFNIKQEVGLVASSSELDAQLKIAGGPLWEFYSKMKAYVPTEFLTAFMAIPFPKMAKEVLFIVEKSNQKKLF